MCVAYIFIIPFIRLYTKGVNDVNYIYPWLPLMFCLVKLLDRIRIVSGNLTGLAGYAKKVSVISLVEAFLNLTLSLIFVQIWGINGVLVATVGALPIKVIYVNYLADIVILKRSLCKTLKIYGINFLIFGTTVVVSIFLKPSINSYFVFFLYGIILSLIFVSLSLVFNSLVNRDLLNFIGGIINRHKKR